MPGSGEIYGSHVGFLPVGISGKPDGDIKTWKPLFCCVSMMCSWLRVGRDALVGGDITGNDVTPLSRFISGASPSVSKDSSVGESTSV